MAATRRGLGLARDARPRASVAVLGAVLLLGCSDDYKYRGDTAAQASGSGGSSGSGGAAGAAGSAGTGALPTTEFCGGTGRSLGAVIVAGAFAEQLEDRNAQGMVSIAEGLDIDSRVSDGSDFESCGKRDFEGPDGRPGVDNQFALILEAAAAQAPDLDTDNLNQILDAAFKNGQLLIVMNVEGVDDLQNDDCVSMTLGQGAGRPLFDSDGSHVAYQTFGYDTRETPMTRLPGRIENGRLLAGPGSAVLPVRVLDADFDMPIELAIADMQIEPMDGGGARFTGIVAGGIPLDTLSEVVGGLNVDGSLKNLVDNVVPIFADLGLEDGRCQLISAGLLFQTVPAYVLGAATPPPDELDGGVEGGW